jgi:hypothetical protein
MNNFGPISILSPPPNIALAPYPPRHLPSKPRMEETMNIGLEGGPGSLVMDRDIPLRVCIITGIPVTQYRSLIENFLPKIDGVTRTLSRLLDHLREKGHEALIVGPDNGLVSIHVDHSD